MLLYLFERMVQIDPSGLQNTWNRAKQVGSDLIQTSTSTVTGLVAEIKDTIINPLVRSVEQPIAGLAHDVGVVSQMVRIGTYVTGGWLLYTVYQTYYEEPNRKRILSDMMDTKIKQSRRRRL